MAGSGQKGGIIMGRVIAWLLEFDDGVIPTGPTAEPDEAEEPEQE